MFCVLRRLPAQSAAVVRTIRKGPLSICNYVVARAGTATPRGGVAFTETLPPSSNTSPIVAGHLVV